MTLIGRMKIETQHAPLSAQAIDGWLGRKGEALATDYAPDKIYVKPPPIGQHILDLATHWHLPGPTVAMIAGQICKETAGWQSRFARERNNPGGIGAINSDPNQAYSFNSVREGIAAHVAHLLNYWLGRGAWSTVYGARTESIAEQNWLGTAVYWSDLNGRWAYPGLSYAEEIAALANDLLNFAEGDQPLPDIYSNYVPPAIKQQWFPVNGVSYLGEPMQMKGVCIHETGNTGSGAEAQQNVNYMNSAECIARQASWHATVGLNEIIETIPDTKQAYHASDGGGPGNTHFFAIEGVMCYPVGTPEFKRVLLNHAWYAAKKLRDKELPLGFNAHDTPYDGSSSVAQHNTFARDHKDCPQFYRDAGLWGQFCDAVTHFYNAGGSVPDHGSRFFPETGHSIGGGFLAYFELYGDVDTYGYPLTQEFEEGGRTTQYFQRAVFQYFPANQGTKYEVQLKLLGAEELARRYPEGVPA